MLPPLSLPFITTSGASSNSQGFSFLFSNIVMSLVIPVNFGKSFFTCSKKSWILLCLENEGIFSDFIGSFDGREHV